MQKTGFERLQRQRLGCRLTTVEKYLQEEDTQKSNYQICIGVPLNCCTVLMWAFEDKTPGSQERKMTRKKKLSIIYEWNISYNLHRIGRYSRSDKTETLLNT